MCGKQLPDDANFCMKCGAPLRGSSVTLQRSFRWEYKDVTIPLGLNTKSRTFREQVDTSILQRLQEEGGTGWQADQPTSFNDLKQSGAFDYSERFGLFGESWDYRSVTIRLKRLIP